MNDSGATCARSIQAGTGGDANANARTRGTTARLYISVRKRTLVRVRRERGTLLVCRCSSSSATGRASGSTQAFEAPTPAQEQGWPAIASGEHTLIQAPTGSGKTLAAFLYGIDRLTAAPGEGLRLLYVSPLKALNYDVERNLRGPLAGLQSELNVAVRTGDTPRRSARRCCAGRRTS